MKSGGGSFSMPAPDIPRMADVMYDGHKAGVDYLKIPRTMDFGGLKKFMRDAAALIGLLDEGISRDDFRARFGKIYVSDKV